MLRFAVAAVVACAATLGSALGQSPLDQCAGLFIGGDVGNAPTIGRSPTAEPFRTNHHLCYRVDETSFFALEYWPEQFAPRWTAYRLEPENYGSDGCRTYTRDKRNCYVTAETLNRTLVEVPISLEAMDSPAASPRARSVSSPCWMA